MPTTPGRLRSVCGGARDRETDAGRRPGSPTPATDRPRIAAMTASVGTGGRGVFCLCVLPTPADAHHPGTRPVRVRRGPRPGNRRGATNGATNGVTDPGYSSSPLRRKSTSTSSWPPPAEAGADEGGEGGGPFARVRRAHEEVIVFTGGGRAGGDLTRSARPAGEAAEVTGGFLFGPAAARVRVWFRRNGGRPWLLRSDEPCRCLTGAGRHHPMPPRQSDRPRGRRGPHPLEDPVDIRAAAIQQ